MKFYYIIYIFELQCFDNDMTVLFNFFLKFARKCVLFLYFFQRKKYYNLLFKIHSSNSKIHKQVVFILRTVKYAISFFIIFSFLFLFFSVSQPVKPCDTKMVAFSIKRKFFKKGIAFPPQFVYDFLRKFLLMLYSFYCLIAIFS